MMTRDLQAGIETILKAAPVVPVMVIERVADAVPLARALVKGGLPVLEITLRTAAASESIRAITAEVKGAIIGVGTVITPAQMADMDKLGCAFAVSPGSSPLLLQAAITRGGYGIGRHEPTRAGLPLSEIFPRRTRRRCRLSSFIGATPAANSLLPHRRNYPGIRAKIFEASQRYHSRRILDGAEEIDRGWRLGGN
jgi:hypothetical protein